MPYVVFQRRTRKLLRWPCSLAVLLVAGCHPPTPAAPPVPSAQLERRPALLVNMPDASPPRLLSQVGAFSDLKSLKPVAGLMPYEINVPFWSDGAEKSRWVGVPAGEKVGYSKDGDWRFPAGTVLVKNFGLPSAQGGRTVIETRVLLCDGKGGVRGGSYRWRRDGSDADLVKDATTVPLGRAGDAERSWYFPGVEDCRVCHTPGTGGVLGIKTRQLNRPLEHGGENQLVAWQKLGLFRDGPEEIDPAQLPKLSPAGDESASVEARARSFLDANCSNCHRPGGVAGNFDARFSTPLAQQNLIDGPVLIDLGIDRARVIAPRDAWRSIALARVETHDLTRMPPLAHQTEDESGAKLLRAWINSMPGPEVLAPPTITPGGGEYHGTLHVTLSHADPKAAIHYTLDGSAPGKSSPVYTGPIELKDPATLRARAYKEGVTRSVIVQETFVVND